MTLTQKEVKAVYLGTNKVRPVWRLPSTYQEVEYIQSSGTQYINLGWKPTDNYFKVVSDATVYDSGNEWSVLFWMTNWSNALSLHFRTTSVYDLNVWWYANIGSTGNIYSSISFVDWENVNINFTWNAWSYTLGLNGDTSIWNYNSTVAQSTRPFYLFAFNENWNITRKTHMRLYSFKLYSWVSTLIRDLVPCYRKSDSVIGMYDLVNDTFYTNAGTGTFTKWADV